MKNENLCPFQQRAHYSISFILLLVVTLLPFGSWFGCFFWRQLNALPQETAVSPMTRFALKVYITTTTSTLWLSAAIHLLFPLLNALNLHGLVLCAVVSCAQNLSICTAYVVFQRVLLEQLKVTFANTTHAIGFRVATAFDALQLCLCLCMFVAVYAWTHPCVAATHFYEMPGTKQHIFCRMRNGNFYSAIVAVFAITLIGGNVSIVVMYVWRMKAVFLDANLRVANDLHNDFEISIHASKNIVLAMDLMRKSTVVTIWSVASRMLTMASTPLPFETHFTMIDLVLNEVLVYCLFPVGDDLYDTLLGFCHFTVDCYLPQRTLAIEQVYIDEMTQPRAGQSLDGRSAAAKPDETSSVS